MSSESPVPSSEPSSPAGIPEELPPVTPPSAGFIIQLFLIPALIVLAVIAVWGLFGQLAGSEVDVDRLVSELGNNNEHRRWRAAHNLYVLLQNDRHADPNDVDRLGSRRDVAQGLTDLLNESLDSPASDDPKKVNHQVFLARALGSLEAEDLILPTLARAMSDRQDPDVRKSAMMSLMLIASSHFAERTGAANLPTNSAGPDLSPLASSVPLPLSTPTIDNEDVLASVSSAAQDSDSSIRHLAAYALGLISGPDAIELLHVLLLDNDDSTQVNAAIALARNANIDGIPTILRVLEEGSVPISPDTFRELPEVDQKEALAAQLFDQSTALVNCLTAVCRLWDKIPTADRDQIHAAVATLEAEHASPGIRMHASAVLREINSRTTPE